MPWDIPKTFQSIKENKNIEEWELIYHIGSIFFNHIKRDIRGIMISDKLDIDNLKMILGWTMIMNCVL